MSHLRDWLAPPKPEAGPREKLAWARRIEIVSGIIALGFGIQLWSAGWWHWLLIAAGLLGLSPWPGPQQILRRAEHHPEVLNHDRDRGYRRARRFVVVWVPIFVIGATALGYAYGRWLGAGINFVLIGLGAGVGAWWSLRRLR